MGRIYRACASTGLSLLKSLETESDRLQDRIASGQIAASSGNGFSKTSATTADGPTVANMASLAGEMLARFEWACDMLDLVWSSYREDNSKDADIYAQMAADMGSRPPNAGAPAEVYSDFSQLRTTA